MARQRYYYLSAERTGNKKPQDTLNLGYFRTHDNREYRISQAFAG